MNAAPLLLFVALAFAPDTPALVRQLGATSFREREAAEQMLAARMSWALAMRLERAKPVNSEAARRLNRLIGQYWRDGYLNGHGWRDVPRLDAFNLGSRPLGLDDAMTRHYLRRAYDSAYPTLLGSSSASRYRAATILLLGDLCRWRVPPAIVRAMLDAMKKRSGELERP